MTPSGSSASTDTSANVGANAHPGRPSDSPPSTLTGLNPRQAEAVAVPAGPVLVLAGPGSGKTRVLTHRAAFLVDELAVPPWQIMAVTFTNKAAREMAERVIGLIGEEWGQDVTVGTFHATCARILRREADRTDVTRVASNFVIYDSADQLRVVKRAMEDLNISQDQHDPRGVLGAISSAKNELTSPEGFVAGSYREEVVLRTYRRYQELLTQANALDFDDLLTEATWLLERAQVIRDRYRDRYRHVLVDEFQDTNTAQYALLKQLVDPAPNTGDRNLFVVGDEDQSIYSWRGADFRNVQRFRRDFPDARVVLLEQNYRSTQNILDAAGAVIDRNVERTPKKLWTEAGRGAPVTLFQAFNEAEEAAYVVRGIRELQRQGHPLGSIAVMYRTNAMSRAVEDALARLRIPYQLVGATRFYDRREVKDVIAYLRLVQNPEDDVSFERVVNVPPRGIGKVAFGTIRDWAEAEGSLWRALQALVGGNPPPRPGLEPADTRTRNALLGFAEIMDTLLEAKDTHAIPELVTRILAETDYGGWLRDGSEEGEDRWENVRELRGLAEDFSHFSPTDGLTALLESVALVADVDAMDSEADRVTLMTLHAGKGLEFDTVFILGLEENLLPHARSLEDPAALEEERRLFYVGITRARKQLVLTHAYRRSLYGGDSSDRDPSRFLDDLPEGLLDVAGQTATRKARPRAPDRTVWTTRRADEAQATDHAVVGFRPGDRVTHPRFGQGTVVSSRIVGDDEEVTVAFEGAGIKKLLQSYAGLTRA